MEKVIRAEYPRPQFVRKNWMNLNGLWQFEIDQSKSGMDRELYKAEALKDSIIVPFCPESKLSGVGFTDFMNCVWYRREIELCEEWLQGVQHCEDKILLHFGAVDYKAIVYVNGEEAGSHIGGYVSFTMDITKYLNATTKNVITICV